MTGFISDIAFTPAVKAEQTKRGSRAGYQRMAEKGDWRDRVDDDLAAFLAERDSFYFATTNSEGQPYIQHRGGPRGLLKVIDEKTLGFADFTGNKQYISLGNLAENPKAAIFLMDYANRRRIKLWGNARVVEDDPELLAQLHLPGYPAKPARAILFAITAWDVNCPQHIPQKFDLAEVEAATSQLTARIAELELEIEHLNGGLCQVPLTQMRHSGQA